ncbi:MAG: ADP-ribosylglycohydrolase family protein [Candidatus Bathyarchaeota archaeon]|nr:ADP-ribosylglycohydrolase family protein [Candidatus Bathyarchaeota archaeon]
MTVLFDKVYGCIAGAFVGSAMGAAVEGWEWLDIQAKYGVLQELLPYAHYRNLAKPGSGRTRPAGTTEDGVERIKLLILAIGEKKGRISADDLGKTWLKHINLENFGVQMEPCDEILYRIIGSGVHPSYAGLYSDFTGIVSFARSCHPIGLINACDPAQAHNDVFDVGRLYQPLHGGGLDWAAAVACGIAEAINPDSTVDTVIDAAREALPEQFNFTFDRAIELAKKSNDPFELREKFDSIYSGRGIRYNLSMAEEIVPKGFSIFSVTGGNFKDSIVGGVNFGRDTDCCTAIAAGLAGAFSGISNLPTEWIEQVDKATSQNEYTVSKLSMEETSKMVHEAILNRKEKLDKILGDIDRLI